jgi:hypothetical protein
VSKLDDLLLFSSVLTTPRLSFATPSQHTHSSPSSVSPPPTPLSTLSHEPKPSSHPRQTRPSPRSHANPHSCPLALSLRSLTLVHALTITQAPALTHTHTLAHTQALTNLAEHVAMPIGMCTAFARLMQCAWQRDSTLEALTQPQAHLRPSPRPSPCPTHAQVLTHWSSQQIQTKAIMCLHPPLAPTFHLTSQVCAHVN